MSHPPHLCIAENVLTDTTLHRRILYQVGLGGFKARSSLPGITTIDSSDLDPIITNLTPSKFISLPLIHPPYISKQNTKSMQNTYFLKIRMGLQPPLGLCSNSLAGIHFGTNLKAHVLPYPIHILLSLTDWGPCTALCFCSSA